MFLSRFLKDPERAQRRVLRNNIRKAQHTEWGRLFGFREIGAIGSDEDFVRAYQERVPLLAYREMRSYVERMREGECDVLWPGRIKYFAASSGTTSAGRIVPVSSEMLASNRKFSLTVAANYLKQTGKGRILLGKHLSLPGWIEDDRPGTGSRIGQISAILAESSAAMSIPWRAMDNRLGFIENWEEKMAAIADHTIDQDIRLIVVAPSWCQVLFRLVSELYRTRTGHEAAIGEIWPNLTTVITGGVALSGYRDILRHYIGRSDVDLLETYGASEGFISFQNDLSDPAMLLHLDCGVFYEFVPINELDSAHPTRLTIGEVEPDVRYALHMTSNSGFWSYSVGDVIRFTSVSPHKILVAGRTVDMLDKYGEAVFGEEARAALDAACKRTNSTVLHYHVTHTPPDPGRTPAHHWLIEFEKPPFDEQAFIDALDEELKKAGHHYDDRREGMAFARPIVTQLEPGTFFSWMEASGRRLTVQTKVPAMSEEREFADDVLRWVKSVR